MTEAELEDRYIKRKIRDLEDRIKAARAELTPREYDQISDLQMRADSALQKFGERAPAPRPGERPGSFRIRTLQALQRHSPRFREFDVARADAALLDVAERQILEDAKQTIPSGSDMKGRLVRVVEPDASGRKITKFYGDNLVWMSQFMRGPVVCRVLRPGDNNA